MKQQNNRFKTFREFYKKENTINNVTIRIHDDIKKSDFKDIKENSSLRDIIKFIINLYNCKTYQDIQEKILKGKDIDDIYKDKNKYRHYFDKVKEDKSIQTIWHFPIGKAARIFYAFSKNEFIVIAISGKHD